MFSRFLFVFLGICFSLQTVQANGPTQTQYAKARQSLEDSIPARVEKVAKAFLQVLMIDAAIQNEMKASPRLVHRTSEGPHFLQGRRESQIVATQKLLEDFLQEVLDLRKQEDESIANLPTGLLRGIAVHDFHYKNGPTMRRLGTGAVGALFLGAATVVATMPTGDFLIVGGMATYAYSKLVAAIQKSMGKYDGVGLAYSLPLLQQFMETLEFETGKIIEDEEIAEEIGDWEGIEIRHKFMDALYLRVQTFILEKMEIPTKILSECNLIVND